MSELKEKILNSTIDSAIKNLNNLIELNGNKKDAFESGVRAGLGSGLIWLERLKEIMGENI